MMFVAHPPPQVAAIIAPQPSSYRAAVLLTGSASLRYTNAAGQVTLSRSSFVMRRPIVTNGGNGVNGLRPGFIMRRPIISNGGNGDERRPVVGNGGTHY